MYQASGAGGLHAAAARRFARPLFAIALLASCAAAFLPETADAADTTSRVQMHRNAQRGVPYVTLAQPSLAESLGQIQMEVIRRINLDGTPVDNVRGNVYPIDVDGNGDYEYVHFNGYRFMRVYNEAGQKLWQINNATGRLHRDFVHRDTLAVLDVDGDNKQDIVHCWAGSSGKRQVVARRGSNGSVIRAVTLDGGNDEECQIGAFRVDGRTKPIVLVSAEHTNGTACPNSNWVDTWARTIAFDVSLNQLWDRNTCYAGHYVYPVDTDGDGSSEHIFIGRHLYDPDGNRRCTLPGWNQDHADVVSVADLDRSRPGLEAVVTGRTGMRAVRVPSCEPLWTYTAGPGDNPQNQAVAWLDPDTAPTIVVRQRGSEANPSTYYLDGTGKILKRFQSGMINGAMPIQNANIDGDRGSDDLVTSFGRVFDRNGNMRLDRNWYWNLEGTKVKEVAGPNPTYDQWAPFPTVVDINRDGRDDILTWSQSLIVVGRSTN